jgi:hypothetical protein
MMDHAMHHSFFHSILLCQLSRPRDRHLLPHPVQKLEPQGESHARDMILGDHGSRTYRAWISTAGLGG